MRQKATGRLVQVIEGMDIRLLNAGYAASRLGSPNPATSPGEEQVTLDGVPILMARRGKKNDAHGQSVELLELVKTTPISTSPASPVTEREAWGQ